MATLGDVARTTDVDRVARLIADACNRMRRLETEGELAFAQLLAAQAEAKTVGTPFELETSAGLGAWLSDFKQRIQRAEAHAIASAELGNG